MDPRVDSVPERRSVHEQSKRRQSPCVSCCVSPCSTQQQFVLSHSFLTTTSCREDHQTFKSLQTPKPQDTMTRTIVILGASYAGIPVAHYLLKHTASQVKGGLKVILVSPNSHMYWCVAVVRGIVPDLMSDDRIFYPIAPAFAKYPAEQFEFIEGKAESLNPKGNSVVIHKNDGSQLTISYDDMYVRGSSCDTPPPHRLCILTGLWLVSSQLGRATRKDHPSRGSARPRRQKLH